MYSLLIPKLVLEAYPKNPDAMSNLKSNNLSDKLTSLDLGFTLWNVRLQPFFVEHEKEQNSADKRYFFFAYKRFSMIYLYDCLSYFHIR